MSLIYFLLFTSFVISSHPGYSMKIVITPNNYDGIIPTAFNIVCIPEVTGNCVRKILAIQVAKNGSRPLATLQQNSKVSYHPLLRSSVQAEGVINTGAANSKLTVTFSDVVKQDSGVYTCTSIYLDEWGHLQQDAASHNFTVKDHDIHDIVRYLVGKLSSMETLVHTLKSQLAEQESDIGKLDNRTTACRNEVTTLEKTVTDQEKQLQEQSKHSKEQDAKVTTLEKTVTDQEKQLQEQSKHSKEQDAKVSSNVNALMATDRNQSKMIEALTDKDSYSSAFRAGYNYNDKLVNGDTLVFSVPLLDVGNDYNTTTGIFTAPKKGLYVFDLSVRAYGSNPKCPAGWSYYGADDSCIKGYKSKLNFNDARNVCQKANGDLVKVTSDAKADLLYGLVGNGDIWMGVTDIRNEGTFEYVDRTPLTSYHPWHPEQPDNNGGNEDCVGLWRVQTGKPKLWNDFPCNYKTSFACEMSLVTVTSFVHVDLKANGETVASVYAHDYNHFDQSSVSTVVSLQAGDQVRPVVRDFNGYNYLDSSHRYTIFSGFLLKMT